MEELIAEPAPTEIEEKALPATGTLTEEAGEVEALINDRCLECYSVDRVFNADNTEEGWNSTIDRMVDYGATVSEEEKQLMIEWLVSRDE